MAHHAYAARMKGLPLPKVPATILAVKGGAYLGSALDGKTADVMIWLTGQWRGMPLRTGTELEFEGKSEAIVKEPYRLTVRRGSGEVWKYLRSRRGRRATFVSAIRRKSIEEFWPGKRDYRGRSSVFPGYCPPARAQAAGPSAA